MLLYICGYRLAQEGEGFKIAMAGLDGGRLNIGSCSLGAAQACFEIALDYVKVSCALLTNLLFSVCGCISCV